MEKFAAIDFETANWQQTSVCSVGIVVMNRGVIEDRFYSLIHPAPNFYSRRNTAIHGLSRRIPRKLWLFLRYGGKLLR